jgi:hypothetical protein
MPPIPPAAAVEEAMPAMPVSVGDIYMPVLVGVAIAMLAEVIISIADDMDISIAMLAEVIISIADDMDISIVILAWM